MTEEEATKIISNLIAVAGVEGVGLYELNFIAPFVGLFRWHPGEAPKIILEANLSIKEKAWVLAHEMGHLFTAAEIVEDTNDVDLIFGEDKALIATVEQAADKWASDYITGTIRGIRGVSYPNSISTQYMPLATA